jgi:transposase
MYPTPAQQTALLEQCRHARTVWNLALEQWSMWTPDRRPAPQYVEQARQLTEARAVFGWLRAGSQTVQQQALRDFDQAVKNYYNGTHRRPTWRKAGLHEGFRSVGRQASRLIKLNGKWAKVNVPKVGWVRFRLSRAVAAAKSYRIARDSSGRWHLAYAVLPPPTPAPGTGDVVGVDRGMTVSAALSTGELLSCPGLSEREQERLNRRRAKAGLNRGILSNGWGSLVQRLEHKAAGRIERVNPAYTSQTCSVCGHSAPENRESQAEFRCVVCGHQANADVNAAVNIAAGRAVSARRETPGRVSPKREPQHATST